jgi:hypothetical protein
MQSDRVVPILLKHVRMLLPYYVVLRLRISAVLVTGMRAAGITGFHVGCTSVLTLRPWNEKCGVEVVGCNRVSVDWHSPACRKQLPSCTCH